MTLAKRVQHVVIRTAPYQPFRAAYALSYSLALRWLMRRLKREPEIQSVDLCKPRWRRCFGSSDLDLRAQTIPLSAPAYFALADRFSDVLLAERSWLRIFDLHLGTPAELELHRRLASQWYDRGDQWSRQHGAGKPAPEAPESRNSYLGRITHDYGYICRDLFEQELDLGAVRLIYKKVMQIHQETEGRLTARSAAAALSSPILKTAAAVAFEGHVRPAGFDELARAQAFALSEVTSLCQQSRDEAYPEEGAPMLVDDTLAPETLQAAVDSCRPAIAALCASLGGSIRSAILGAVPGCSYEYRIYLIVPDDLPDDPDGARQLDVCRAVRSLFTGPGAYRRIPDGYFRLRYPTLLTHSAWRARSRWYHSLRPVEECYFIERHGVVLWGEDLRHNAPRPVRQAVLRSAAVAVADLRNPLWSAIYLDKPARLADLIAGRIPALWLALENLRIATSAPEAVNACRSNGFPHWEKLDTLRRRIAGLGPRDLPPVRDPSWQPCLDSLTDWLDGLNAMALRALAREPG
jgi:hypothetical protein